MNRLICNALAFLLAVCVTGCSGLSQSTLPTNQIHTTGSAADSLIAAVPTVPTPSPGPVSSTRRSKMDLSCSPGVEAYADDGTDSGGSLGCYMPNDGAPVNPYSGGGGSGRQSACELGYWSQCPPNYFWGGQSPYCSYGFVDFSSGCESDAAAYANAWPKWYNIVNFQEDGYILRTDPTHYWNKHLACYLPGTSQAFTSAAAGNFFLFVYVPGRAPALQTYEDYNFVYEGFVVTYRIFKVSQGFYALTTAFLVKYNNCPGY